MNKGKASAVETLGAWVGVIVLVPVIFAGVMWVKAQFQSAMNESDRQIAEQEQIKDGIKAAQNRGLEACKAALVRAVAPSQVLDYFVPGHVSQDGDKPYPKFYETATGYSFTYGVDVGGQRVGAQCYINQAGDLLRAIPASD